MTLRPALSLRFALIGGFVENPTLGIMPMQLWKSKKIFEQWHILL
jgi:hypothetical protein